MDIEFLVQMRQSDKCGGVRNDDIFNLHLGSGVIDHNSIIIENNESANTAKKKTYNHQWKNNSNINQTRFIETMQDNIINDKPKKYEELEKIIIQTAVEVFGLFKNNNELYTNKKKQKKTKTKSKKEYEVAIRIKNAE